MEQLQRVACNKLHM